MGLISERRFSQDFKIVPEFDEVRGEYFVESKRSNVYLSKHECIEVRRITIAVSTHFQFSSICIRPSLASMRYT